MQSGIYTKDEISKIGNTIIYLSEKIDGLPKTKLLKLLYLLEEYSVRKSGAPFLGLRFDIWRLGPVSRDIFVELSDELVLLADYIHCENSSEGRIVRPSRPFSDDEFSDNEMELLQTVTEKYGALTGAKLVEITHNKHSLWYNTAQKYGLLDSWKQGLGSSATDQAIDFSALLEDFPEKKAMYLEHRAFLTFTKSLKN